MIMLLYLALLTLAVWEGLRAVGRMAACWLQQNPTAHVEILIHHLYVAVGTEQFWAFF